MSRIRTITVSTTIALGLGIVFLWALGAQSQTATAAQAVEPSSALARTRVEIPHAPTAELQVCPAGCPYTSVQAAVDAAAPGSVLKVAAGTYTDLHARDGFTQVVYISKTVTLQGGYTTANGFADPPNPDANPTILDAQGKGRVIVILDAGPTIEGFTITGGYVEKPGGVGSGGGIYIHSASPTIRNNWIVDNSADGDGGAIFVNHGSAQILENRIVGNTATWAGGLRIINDADVQIVGNLIEGNVAQNTGGGIDVDCCGGTTPLIARNVILNNDGSARGGGIIVNATYARLVNNVLAGNRATDGAGLFLEGSAGYPVSVTLIHNTLAGGPSGGEALWVGTYVTATLVNNVVFSHTVGLTNTTPASAIVTADYTLFDATGVPYGSGVSSAHEFSGDLAFVNPTEGDYHLGRGSAAIDQGTPTGVTDDLDGDPRPTGPLPDLGADEVQRYVFLPLVLRGS
jgi:hypothetical protein